jgi:hypothetical protein
MNTQAWAQRAEIVASCAVVVTLVFVILEIRSNTLAIERQASLDRASGLSDPFFTSPDMPGILAKVKAVDGLPPLYRTFADRYDLSVEESILWERHLLIVWTGLEADYLYSGPSEPLEILILDLLSYPDNQVHLEYTKQWFTDEFASYVDSVQADL